MNFTHIRQKYLNTKVWSALEFIRIFNMSMPFTSGFIGVVMASEGIHLNAQSLSGMFIPVFLWAGGQVFNDIFDADVDAINTPYRAVPSGRFTLRGAVAFGGAITLVGITLSIVTKSFLCQMLTVFAVIMSSVYSYTSKRKGISGHMNFAFCVLLCIYIGQSAVSGGITFFYAPIGVFLYHIAINIMASVGDVSGDEQTKVVTLPVQIGKIKSTYVALIFWIGGVSWSIRFSEVTGGWLAVISLVILISLYNTQLLLRYPSPGNATTTLRLFRLGTIMLQFSLVIQYLDITELTIITCAIGVFTIVTFLFFEIPKGVHVPGRGVTSLERG